jgi:plasmid stabilization system protein ParE
VPRYKIELSPEAAEQADAIQVWWVENRPKNRALFLRELRAAVRQVRRSPFTGKLYEAAGVRPTRRILLPKTGYHMYYWPDETATIIRVYAVWYGGRGNGPPFPR